MNSSQDVQLTPCQTKAFSVLKNTNDNIFLTGFAGSGKSFLIKKFLKGQDLKKMPVLASTGAAAVLIGGRTFHSFFGLGIMQGDLNQIVERALNNKQLVKRLREIEGFVLDEVSMISDLALQAAEAICSMARKNTLEPWGGVRVIVVGDFSQLPPVTPKFQKKPWAFLSDAWKRSCFTPLVLKTLVRSNDLEFLNILKDIRNGDINESVVDYLNMKTYDDVQDLIDVPYFFPYRRQSDLLNQQRLHEIDNHTFEFKTKYSGNPNAIASLKKNLFMNESLVVKKSAFVMIRVNDPKYKYVNGSLGHILEIEETKDETILHIELTNRRIVEIKKMSFSILNADGEPIATAENFPITLAYSSTIHKAQGVTVDKMVVDLRGLWEPGQAYVALSRLRSGEGLNLLGWNKDSFKVDHDVIRFYENIES